MSARVARLLATSTLLAIVALAAVEAWMIAVTIDRPFEGWSFRGNEVASALSLGAVGALIAARRPENLIGWICLASGLLFATQGVLSQYPVLAQAVDRPLAGVELAKWAITWVWVPAGTLLVGFVPLIFPDGRLLSGRWRAVVGLGLAGGAYLIGLYALNVRPIGSLEATADTTKLTAQLGVWALIGFAGSAGAVGLAASSLVLRYRRAAGEERQQIKWLAYAAALFALTFPLAFSPIFLGHALVVGAALLVPVAMGIAILRYRLYEIDLIINRTLVYGALSAILAGVYTASITLSQRLFMAVTGERSDAAIVLTTLIVAATFTPLKTRLQAVVDQRIKAVPSSDVTPPASAVMSAMLEATEDRLRKIVREEIALTARGDARGTG